MSKIDLLVRIAPGSDSDIDQVARNLEDQGLHVDQKLPRFRTIIGSGDSSKLQRFQSVDGVESVRPQKTFELPPMDEKIPQ